MTTYQHVKNMQKVKRILNMIGKELAIPPIYLQTAMGIIQANSHKVDIILRKIQEILNN